VFRKNATAITLWLLWFSCIGALALIVPYGVFDVSHYNFILIIGGIGIWRYSVGITHYIRGMLFLYWVFPGHRKKALVALDQTPPSHIYLLVTSFRIDAVTTAEVYQSVFEEAVRCNYPSTVVASIVEMSDELLVKALWRDLNAPAHVNLKIVRIPGTGKRDGLANGFRCIAKELPDERALVAVVDGDTVLGPNIIARSAPYFSLFPNVGALTTNETCKVHGTYWMSEWHKLRFAQRHIGMCSMALAKRVLTLTGRMSVFRAEVVTEAAFINDVENDYLDHWRLGQFKFLTGDDKSSWYSLMRQGWDTYYVPDAVINTLEHPPHKSFFVSAKQLMFRWYGNSLRQNSRATRLGLRRLGWLNYYVLLDQRVSMWTSLLGLSAAILASIKYSIAILLMYFLWISLTRTLVSFLLMLSGHRIGPTFPLMLYFNQIYGSIIKIYVVFRLDRQSWTRQKTKLKKSDNKFQRIFNTWSTQLMTFASANIFFALIVYLVL